MKTIKYKNICLPLQIGKNPIGDGGVETLLNVVKAHRTIKFLSLEVGLYLPSLLSNPC